MRDEADRTSKYGAALFALSLLVAGFCVAQDVTPLTSCTRESVLAYLSEVEIGTKEAEYIASEYDTRALSPLKEILEDNAVTAQTRAEAAFCIGKIGGPEAASAIITHIQQPRLEPVDTADEYRAGRFAIYALGFIGTDESIEFLKSLCGQDYWLNRDDRVMLAPDPARIPPPPRGVRVKIDDWRDAALGGIAMLGPAKALEVLTELKSTDAVSDMSDRIDREIRYFQDELAKSGEEEEAPAEP